MIEYLSRNQLNIEKYNHCISNAVNTRIYAYAWYLDVVCDDWNVLVKDDYQFVMPLPKRKKYGIHYIYQAPWIQQLGVFSKDAIEVGLVDSFIKKIPKKFKLIDVLLNTNNVINSQKIEVKTNFILPLNKSYTSIRKNYSKGRNSSVKQAERTDLTIVEGFNQDEIIQLFKKNKGAELHKKDADYLVLSVLINVALSLKKVKIYAVTNVNNKLIGGAFFLIDQHRITYLFSALNNEGREKQVMSLLIDRVIKENSGSELILDFEGSMIKPIASFFKSFGAVKETYFHYKKYSL